MSEDWSIFHQMEMKNLAYIILQIESNALLKYTVMSQPGVTTILTVR